MYGSETWTVSQTLAKRFDGCYTRMLRMALNIDWKERQTNAKVDIKHKELIYYVVFGDWVGTIGHEYEKFDLDDNGYVIRPNVCVLIFGPLYYILN